MKEDHEDHPYDHWRMKAVKRDIREGKLDSLAHAAMWNPNGDTADAQEFESVRVASKELLRLAKIGQARERKRSGSK
jgi:hypothetical protein